MPACPRCGQDSPDGFRFCGACGAPLERPAAALAEERKTVTVLFADLVGFTGLADELDTEEVYELIAPFHGAVRDVVVKLGGTVEKFIGDAVMGVFGLPVAREDDPERAVRAALEIRDAVAELSTSAGGERSLGVRVGVNTGEALVRLDLTPGEGERLVADFVNVASRLEQAAPVNGILVGEATYVATARAIEYEAFEPIRAKGKAHAVLAWRATAARARVGADPRRRGSARLVGRERELAILVEAFARVRRTNVPELVTLVGPPGIGKTRLVLELSSVVEDDPELVSWRTGSCLPFGASSAFWPLAEIVRAQAGIRDTDAQATVVDKLRREVEATVADEAEARWVEEHLRRLLGIAAGAQAREPSEGDLAEAFAAWRRFIESLAAQGPLVVVVEDLQHADPAMLDFLEHLAAWARDVPLLVVCTRRPDPLPERPGWTAGTGAATVTLDPLVADEMASLVGVLLASAGLSAELATPVVERSAGNPLYAEEFVRMLAERPDGDTTDELPVPASVHGIIAARLDTLDPACRGVLLDAAVIGSPFWSGAVARLADTTREEVERHLEELERRQFVVRARRSSVDDEREYGFRHVLVREVAYNRLPRAGRIERHRSAAEWLGGLAATDELTERAAHHYVQALELSQALRRDVSGFAERARTVLARAGDHALELHAFAAAVRSYGWAAELWPRDDPQWPMLRFRQGKALVWAHERGRDELAEARDALLAAGERGLAAEAEILLGRLSFRLGHGDETLRHYRAAADLLSAVAPSPSKAMVLYAVARGLLVADQNSAALLVAREALSVAERVGADDVRAGALVVSGLAKVERGELEGLEEAEQGLELGERVNSTEVAVGLFNLADTLMELGRLDEAAVRRERAQRAAERLGDTRSLRWLAPELAGERYWAGEWDEALLLADRFVSTVEREGGHYQEAYARTIRGRIRLARGDAEGALADSERALVVGRAAGDPQALYPALAFRARVSSEAGDRRRCARLASELVALVDEAGAAPSAFLWAHDLALVLTVAGRGQRLVAVTEHVRKRTPWLEAARALASGDAAAAAALYEEIGALPEEASARMVWADQLARAGAPGEADAALARAKAFCARVGAREPNGLPRSGRNAPPTRQRREEQR